MANLSNFGEQFASSVLKRVYANAVVDAIVNRNYEGEIKKPGDRVNILSFLNDILLSDYTVGSDMNSETIIDAEDQLVVEKRRYFNFSLDRLEDLFTYAGDIPEDLLNNASKVLEREIDTYVLGKAGDASVLNWVGTNLVVAGSGVTAGTMASITTTATGGTIQINGNFTAGNFAVVENPVDGNTYMGGFEAFDIGKGIRLRSTSTFVSPWYKITAVASSVSASITEWDGATSGSDFKEGFTLRGIYGGDGLNFPKANTGDQSWMIGGTQEGLGWEFQAAIATSVSAATIYDQVTVLAQKLDEAEISDTDRKLTVPPEIKTQLLQASELQPTGIAEIYSGTVLNGRVMRFAGFDVHMAIGSRVSTRVGKSAGTTADMALTTGSIGYQILANHTGFITYADKWSETRVVDAENQFAKKYQGLFLYGALVPAARRKFGAVLFGNF
jgi:hypothetical protein